MLCLGTSVDPTGMLRRPARRDMSIEMNEQTGDWIFLTMAYQLNLFTIFFYRRAHRYTVVTSRVIKVLVVKLFISE